MKEKFALIRHRLRKVLKVHHTFVVLLIVLVVALAVVLRILFLSNLGSDQGYLVENENKVKTINFRQDAIDEIESLRDSNVNIPAALHTSSHVVNNVSLNIR